MVTHKKRNTQFKMNKEFFFLAYLKNEIIRIEAIAETLHNNDRNSASQGSLTNEPQVRKRANKKQFLTNEIH